MKFAIVLAAGMADEPLDVLRGATPLEAAQTPNMQALAQTGRVGRARTVPQGMDSGAAVLAVLGYDPKRFYAGRGPLEALGAGMNLDAEECALRCDFITTHEDRLIDHSAGHISAAEATALFDSLAAQTAGQPVRFAAGSGYRGAMAVRSVAFDARCTSPSALAHAALSASLPDGPGAEVLRDVMEASKRCFAEHDVNRVRLDLGERPATMVWPWGPGRPKDLPSFQSVFGLGGVAVSADRLVLGVARGIGWGVKDMALRGRGLDPDYREVVAAALDALVEVDVVLAHVEAPAEMSLAGDATGKVCAIEEIDEFVVGPLRAWCEQAEDRRLMVLTDRVVHTAGQTDVDAANHSTPFVISRQRVASARVCPFHEKGAAFSGMVVEQGHELLEYFLKR